MSSRAISFDPKTRHRGLLGAILILAGAMAAGADVQPTHGREYYISTEIDGQAYTLACAEGAYIISEAKWEAGSPPSAGTPVTFENSTNGLKAIAHCRAHDPQRKEQLEYELTWQRGDEQLGGNSDRRLAYWVVRGARNGQEPYITVRLAEADKGVYLRSSFDDGVERELNYTKGADAGPGRLFGVWTPRRNHQPLTLSSDSDGANVVARGLVTNATYFWVINGDGSRNWLRSRPPCWRAATRMLSTDIDSIPKRHSGGNDAGYGLGSIDGQNICNNTGGSRALSLTNRTYFWIVNGDGSRNWIENRSVTADCRRLARYTDSIEDYPKRHDGSGGYTLVGVDAERACRAN